MVKSFHAVSCRLLVAAIAADVGSKCCCFAAMSAAVTAGNAGGHSDRAGYELAMRESDIALYLCACLLGAGWCLVGTGVLCWLWSIFKREPNKSAVPLVLLLVYVMLFFVML